MASQKKKKHPPIVWLDLEMTGLDPDQDQIIEIASLVTDSEMNIIAYGPELVVHADASRFEQMDAWNRNQHTKSGLWERVVASPISCAEAEALTLDFIKQYAVEKKSIMAGNSIWQDRRFIIKHMPSIDRYLHYRMLDVSTLKCLAGYWLPQTKFKKASAHRALDDVKESIKELQFYQQLLFRPELFPEKN